MVLVSSNPTNLVISSASGINFIYFSGWTILPALLSALLLYPLLMFRYFRASPNTTALVPRRLETPDVYPRGELKDVRGAIFKACLLAATLLALIISSVLVKGLFVWWVTVPAALIAFTRDVAHDLKHGSVPEEFAEGEKKEGGAAEADLEMEDVSAAVNGAHGSGAGEDDRDESRWTLPRLVAKFAARLPTVYSVTTRLPWPLLPFAFSFFILVESLSSSGWISVWAGWMSKVVQNNDVVAIFFVGWVCILLCNVSRGGITLVVLSIRLTTVVAVTDLDEHRRNAHPRRHPLRSCFHSDQLEQESRVRRPLRCGCGQQCWSILVCLPGELGRLALAWYVFCTEQVRVSVMC